MISLLVGLHRIVIILLLRIEGVNVAEFEEAEVLALAVHIILDALKTAEQQCLTHHIQIARKGIHDANK